MPINNDAYMRIVENEEFILRQLTDKIVAVLGAGVNIDFIVFRFQFLFNQLVESSSNRFVSYFSSRISHFRLFFYCFGLNTVL